MRISRTVLRGAGVKFPGLLAASVSEIREFCTLYVVAEGSISGCILRFMHAKNHFSDTLIPIRADAAIGIFPKGRDAGVELSE